MEKNTNFRFILSTAKKLHEINQVRDEILQFPEKFDQLFDLIFDHKFKDAWRVAWTVEKIAEKNTTLFSTKNTLKLMEFACTIQKSGLLRSVLSIIINLPLPNEIPVKFINTCFDKMISMKEPVAVQALSMKMLQRIANKEPDFIPEIIVTLENVDTSNVSAGYIAIRRNVLNTLYKKQKS